MASASQIRVARPDDLPTVQRLFREYADGLGVDLSFQGFEAEVADPFAVYELILLAPDGCVALRRIDAETCEMKRLFVGADARGTGAGRRLAEAVIAAARERGYARMLLDTLPDMVAARALYRSLGFHEVDAYRYNPVPGTSYLELTLRP